MRMSVSHKHGRGWTRPEASMPIRITTHQRGVSPKSIQNQNVKGGATGLPEDPAITIQAQEKLDGPPSTCRCLMGRDDTVIHGGSSWRC